jgi:hypothetical protein
VVPTGGELWATDAGTRDDVVAQWEHIMSATYLPWTVTIPELPERNAFRGWVRRWPIDDLLLVGCGCGPCSGRRARHQLADTDGEFVVVMMIHKGAETVSQRHTEAPLTPGDVAAWDSARRNQFTIAGSLSKRSMVIPRAALDEVGGGPWLTEGLVLDPTGPATRLLTSHLDTLSEVLPGLGSAAISAARMAALELFVGALRTDSDVCSAESVRSSGTSIVIFSTAPSRLPLSRQLTGCRSAPSTVFSAPPVKRSVRSCAHAGWPAPEPT